MTNHRPNSAARWIGNVLIIAGAAAVGIWASAWLSLTIWQGWQNRRFDQQRAVPQTQAQPRIPNGGIVGRLAVPRLHVRAMVREGDSDHTLSIALGHIPGTAFPGQKGNVGIAGHRDSLFRGLKNIAANDEITFETPGASYVYRVEGTSIVKPEDTEVLNPGPTRELTLVTCFPFEYVGSAPDRFIVKASLVSENDTARNDIHDEPAPVVAAARPPVRHELSFMVAQGHSRELVPGKIWFGLSSADVADGSVNGWVWIMPERRTVWLRNVDAHRPVIFFQNGERRELVITRVARTSASGYLLPSSNRG
jgi:LPXTG-site transpeptidase (sortase) family protein